MKEENTQSENADDRLIDQAFDAEAFRVLGHKVVDQLADALAETRRAGVPVRNDQSPTAAYEFWVEHLATTEGSAESLVESVLGKAFRSHHPQNLGHQVGPVLPAAAAIEMVGGLLDTGNGIFEVGNPATPMERVVLKELAQRLSYPEAADGVLTSGGSLGNLTALLAMRQRMAGNWDQGAGGRSFGVLVSDEAHYCVTRAARIMGWGDRGVIAVPVDGEFRMRADALGAALERARADGIEVLGVVGSAGSTATGRIDPLGEIADFCQREKLWFHVDAAHAGAYVFSDRARPMLAGIERADSVVIDFHKMLLSPSLLTAVLFKDGDDSFQTFAQQADYLWSEDDSREWWDAAKRTLECTRPMLGLRAYVLLQAGRDGLFAAYIDRTLQVTHEFADLLEAAEDFELLTRPESNIVCYRHTPQGVAQADLDEFNGRVRAELIASGEFYIVQVEKNGRLYLRSALMNPSVERSVCEKLMERIRSIGAS